MSAIFITGTDTGVGKTLVTAVLALSLRQTGRDVGVLKPFATGCNVVDGELVSDDAIFLKEALGLKDSLSDICPIRFEEPLAPLVAARRAGVDSRDWPPKVDKALQKLKKRHEFIVIEGVGGVAVPVCDVDDEVWTVADFISAWDIPSIVVARRTLGTINHTLLTAKTTPNFRGIVFNDAATVPVDDLAAQTSPEFIGDLGFTILGQIDYSTDLSAKRLESVAKGLDLDWEEILCPRIATPTGYDFEFEELE
jgi:dethiobiotin synthetase